MELFEQWMGFEGGAQALGRYAHYLGGITWIGLLYFFNFIQGAAFGEMSDGARGEALRKITWRTLWWFRWAAMLTWVSGIWILGVSNRFENMFDEELSYWHSVAGLGIAFGAILGTTMAANVWMVIWPAQKIAIGSSVAVSEGGEADPEAPAAAKRAGRASRVNTLFSIPLIFFMMWPSHFAGLLDNALDNEGLDGGYRAALWIVFAVIWLVMELSALGKIGGYDSRINKVILEKHQDTIKWGFLITLVLYLLFEILA